MSEGTIAAHWSATVERGPGVMVESTVGSGSLIKRGGTVNSAKLTRVIQDAVRAAKRGNVVRLNLMFQPSSKPHKP
jgi:hypothetical protein